MSFHQDYFIPPPPEIQSFTRTNTHIHTHTEPVWKYWGPYIPSGIDDSIDVLQRDTVSDCCSSLYLCLFHSSSIFIFLSFHQKKRRSKGMTVIEKENEGIRKGGHVGRNIFDQPKQVCWCSTGWLKNWLEKNTSTYIFVKLHKTVLQFTAVSSWNKFAVCKGKRKINKFQGTMFPL